MIIISVDVIDGNLEFLGPEMETDFSCHGKFRLIWIREDFKKKSVKRMTLCKKGGGSQKKIKF